MLARLFDGQSAGFYVDIGAGHPTNLSVTKHFYEIGWSGLNIEPLRSKWAALAETRTRDTNLNLAIGHWAPRRDFYVVEENDDLSTLDSGVAENLKGQGYTISVAQCEAVPLSVVLSRYAPARIDFVKIDVEGAEAEVLDTLDLKTHRPTVMLIEARSDQQGFSGWNSCDRIEPALPEWERSIVDAGYKFAHFDGLNRFYIRDDYAHLIKRLSIPPSVFDSVLPDTIQAALQPMAAKENLIQRLSADLIEKNDVIIRLSADLIEKEELIQRLSADLRDKEVRLQNPSAAEVLDQVKKLKSVRRLRSIAKRARDLLRS
jgi:FkbM family methyltransferase